MSPWSQGLVRVAEEAVEVLVELEVLVSLEVLVELEILGGVLVELETLGGVSVELETPGGVSVELPLPVPVEFVAVAEAVEFEPFLPPRSLPEVAFPLLLVEALLEELEVTVVEFETVEQSEAPVVALFPIAATFPVAETVEVQLELLGAEP